MGRIILNDMRFHSPIGVSEQEKSQGNDFSVNIGDILTILCGVGFTLHMIFIAHYNATEDAILLTVLQLVFAFKKLLYFIFCRHIL